MGALIGMFGNPEISRSEIERIRGHLGEYRSYVMPLFFAIIIACLT